MSAQTIHIPRGFLFSAVSAGIKSKGGLDLALAEIPEGAEAAALFTRNRVVAAPVEIGRQHLKTACHKLRAVIVNSGNANCATGEAGYRNCNSVCQELSKLLKTRAQQVFPSSTGIIGVPLPVDKVISALPQLFAARANTLEAAQQFARAIMTTDTKPKLASARLRLGSGTVTLLGMAKGAGMIHPQMATMLVYLFTDLDANTNQLQKMLSIACNETLNCISIDGDTSTNDTALLAASGKTGVCLTSAKHREDFLAMLTGVCGSLAEQIVGDGEGVKHLVRLKIEQARSRDEALRIARAIANSALVKTAWAGADPNWGRILAAIGISGVPVDPGKINIFFGPQQVCRKGVACAFDERKAHRFLSQPDYEIRVQLGRGRAGVRFLTCDLTAEYVHINADYST